MSRFVVSLLGAAFWMLLLPEVNAAASEEEPCETQAGLRDVAVGCEYSSKTLQAKAESDSGAVYTVYEACFRDTGKPEPCFNPRECDVGDQKGTIHAVLRDGVYVGTACLTAGESRDFTPRIAVIVAKTFKELTWPKSKLTIQPPGGRTLVNFETIFYTTNNEPTTKTLTLLDQTVDVQADPVSYTWHFGDGESETTETAGLPYPEQEVIHTYLDLDPVAPSVDTEYAGSYRVNGGEWQPIEETVMVEGESVNLEILEAVPQLVTDPTG